MRNLTIADMRRLCTDHFFSKDTKRFFRGRKLRAYYYKGQNYIKMSGERDSWYTFSKTGKTNYIAVKNVPLTIRKRAYPWQFR